MDDLDFNELIAGIELLEQVEEDAINSRHILKSVDPFTGKLTF